MSIDKNINEMFSEKNQAIFLNKLLLDLDNNVDTFKLATKHIIMIEIAKLLSSLKKTYSKYSVTIDENNIKDLLSKTKKNLIDEINIVIDEKVNANSDYIEENRNGKINKGYLSGYHKQIDESEQKFIGALNLTVKEVSEVRLYNSLVTLYPCVNEEMQHEMLYSINIDFTNSLISRISNESKHRNMTLKNISDESYQKYLEISKNTELNNKTKTTPAKAKVKK